MKIFIAFIFTSLILASCDNPRSARHLFRAASKTTEKNQTAQFENMMSDIGIGPKIHSYKLVKDSAGTAFYKANYIMEDTLQYIQLTSIKAPYDLKFNKKSHSYWVANISFFLDSVSNTPYDSQTVAFKDSIFNGYEFKSEVLSK